MWGSSEARRKPERSVNGVSGTLGPFGPGCDEVREAGGTPGDEVFERRGKALQGLNTPTCRSISKNSLTSVS